MADYYLPSFKGCVQEGHSKGIMCSYNAVNEVPTCANDLYLNDTLRNSWKFDGCASCSVLLFSLACRRRSRRC